jgi:hypothetical protein
MAKGRRPTGFEEMDQRPGFRATGEQLDWLERARIAVGEMSLSEWLRRLAVTAGEKALGEPYPRRVQIEQPAPRKNAAEPKKPKGRR